MTLVIGIVGMKGSGKGTFADALARIVPPQVRIVRVRMSDILRETLDLWRIPQTRANLQNLSKIMDAEFGNGTLAHAVGHRLANVPADVVVVDGVRWEADRLLVRSFPNHFLIAITVAPQVRFQRLRSRGENARELRATFEQFLLEEQAISERAIPTIIANADITIANEGTVEQFAEAIRACWREQIAPRCALQPIG